MPVNQNNYNRRGGHPSGGNNFGIVVRCPNLVADRLVYFDHHDQSNAWGIRDFISGLRIDQNSSPLMVSQIEADANHDEFPPWHDARNTDDWRTYLALRTTAVFAIRSASTAPPNAQSGNWHPL